MSIFANKKVPLLISVMALAIVWYFQNRGIVYVTFSKLQYDRNFLSWLKPGIVGIFGT